MKRVSHELVTFVFLLGAAAAGLSLPLSAAEKIPLTIENIHTQPNGVRQAVISPDGQHVAFAAEGPGGRGIYLVSTSAAPGDPKFWLDGNSPVWFPDGKRLLFTRDDDLWSVPIGSIEATRITKDKDPERAPAVSPDGKTIAFYSGKSGHQDIWVVAADGRAAPRQLVQQVTGDDDFRFAPSWSPDSKQLAYISNKSDYWHDDVWLLDVATGTQRQVSHDLMAASTPAWSPDGKSIALLGTSKRGFWYQDLANIYVVDPVTGSERTVKMQVYATDAIMSMPVFWSEDGRHIFFMYQERGDVNLWSVPVERGVATRVTSQRGTARSVDTTPKTDAFIWVRALPTRGPEVEYVPAIGGQVRQLTHLAPQWESVDGPEEISYRSFDGLYIQGFLYLPPGMKEGHRYPALVNVHGGGTNSYMRGQNLMENYLASKGYVVLAINYRGGSGFGREFQDLSINDWVNGQAQDAAIAADFMRSLPYVNGKVGIYGYSYGGIMSLGTIARYPEKYDAAVPMAGIYDFADAYTNADRVGKIFLRTGHGGSPDERKEIYAISNTLARLSNVKTPLLIMHGEADVRAPFQQYQLAVKLLKQHGKTFESKSYPGEPHGFRDPQNRIDMYRRLEAFFDKHLRTPVPSSRQ